MNEDSEQADGPPEEERKYYTARHLLLALQNLDDNLLDRPLILVHGKQLQKPNLVGGWIPMNIPIDRSVVEAKPPALLTLGELVDRLGEENGR